ncbi:MAG TPA: VWA domain-containing protein [Terriglobales bacterium]|jgi:VWFA-related protein
MMGKFGWVAVGLVLGWASALSAQRPGPGEVHITQRDYRLAPLVIQTTANSVTLDVVVRDRNGLPVSGLQRQEFRILDNGQPRPLASFQVQTAPAPPSPSGHPGTVSPASTPAPSAVNTPPRYLALYFDDVNTDNKALQQARNAALRFVQEALGLSDHAAVLTGSGSVSQEFTTDHARLQAAIAAVRAHPRAETHSPGCLRITAYQAYLIANHLDPSALAAAMANQSQCDNQAGIVDDYTGKSAATIIPGGDAAAMTVSGTVAEVWDQARAASIATLHSLEDAVDYTGRQPGERELILASSGFLSGTLEGTQDEIIQMALHRQVTINSLEARGLYTEGPGLPIDEVSELEKIPEAMYHFQETSKLSEEFEEESAMSNLAQSTGGLLFHNNNDLTLGFYRLGLTAATTYELSFAPQDLVHDGKFHKLKVEVTPDQHYTVEARHGYFAPAPENAAADPQAAVDAAMRSGHPAEGLPASVRVSAETAPAGPTATVHLRLDVSGVPFRKDQGREFEHLVFVAGLFDAQGNLVSGKRAEMDLALKDNSWRAMKANGLNASFSLSAPSGSYHVRCVIAEQNQGKLYAITEPVVLQ